MFIFENMDINRQALVRKALWLEYFTVGYNVLEGLASIAIGVLANSIALISFGIDSFVESLSGGILIWRLKAVVKDEQHEKEIEKKAMRYIGYSFIIFSIYVTYEAIKKLYFHEKPEVTILGIMLALLSLIIMPFLTWQKYKAGKALHSRSLVADSKQTLACVLLSVILLIGLALNYLFNLWWADPLASLLIVIFMVREGIELFEGD